MQRLGLFLCSYKCADTYRRQRYRELNPPSTLNRSDAGTVNELRVCLDLMLHGYEVFRAVSSGATCDLAVLRDHTLLRVEVKAGWRSNLTGEVASPTGRPRQVHDILAIVLRTGEIIYRPPLPS